jgi:hypothetical protein
MPKRMPVYDQVADYLSYFAIDLKMDKPGLADLAHRLDALQDRIGFYANVLHTMSDRPILASPDNIPIRRLACDVARSARRGTTLRVPPKKD